MYIKCEICGEVFCGHANRKYCSDECRKIANEARREYYREYYKANRDQKIKQQKEYYKANTDQIKKYYKTNKDQIIERQNEYHERKIRELTEQYPSDLKTILKQCPNIWMERETKMQVWFNESYAESIIKKIKTTPVCEVTGEKDNLVIHHLYSFNTHPELGNDPANMVRITKQIHKQFHTIYGYGNNTPEQWMEFIF